MLLKEIKLHEYQYNFLYDQTPNLAAVTGIGGGKTWVGAAKAIKYGGENAGATCLITAPTYPMLRNSTLSTFFELCPPEIIREYNKADREVLLKNGTKYLFRSTTDPETLRGVTVSFIWMDEAALSTEYAWKILKGRLRDPRFPRQIIITTTPKGRQHWLFKNFGGDKLRPDFGLYKWSTKDNTFLAPDYYESLREIYSGQFALQELEGEFITQQGLVYGGFFDRSIHVGDYPYRPEMPVVLAWDFGFSDPTAVLVIQRDSLGRVFVIEEIFATKTPDDDIVADLKSRPWFDKIRDCVCDSAKPERILQLSRLGLPARGCRREGGGKDSIELGIQRVCELLRVDSVLGTPRLFIDKRCEQTCIEFETYSYPNPREDRDGNVTNISQKPVDAYNHTLDALRYYIVTAVVPKITTIRPQIPYRRRRMAYDKPYHPIGRKLALR
jgi:PBSX family phage terminase large subunit